MNQKSTSAVTQSGNRSTRSFLNSKPERMRAFFDSLHLAHRFFVFVLFAGTQILSANPFYVSPTGSDSNNGSEGAPFQTIERARGAVRSAARNQDRDIVVYLRKGRYELGQTLHFDGNDSGRNGHKVIYRSMPGEEVRISGGRRVTGWKHFRDGIYRADAPVPAFRQLYIDGNRGIRARTPNHYYERLRHWGGDKTIDVPAHTVGNWSNRDQVEIVINKHWHQSRLRIADIHMLGDTAKIIPQQPERDVEWRVQWPNREPNQPYYFENSLDFLDQPGEWYLDRRAQHVYYLPRPGENIETAEVIAPHLEQVLRIDGANHLHFVGLIFEDTNWTLPDQNGFIPIQANLYVNPGTIWMPSGIHVQNAHHVRFERNVLRNMGGGAIALHSGTYQTEIVGNAIAAIAASGISVYTDIHQTNPPEHQKSRGDIVRNNYITRVGQDYPGGVAIVGTYTDGLIIEHNEIFDNPYTGISVGWGWTSNNTALRNNVVRYNRIHQVMNLLDDGAAIYTLSKQPGGIYEENFIYDMTRNPYAGSYMITALYLDEQTEGISIRNNVVRNLAGVEEFKTNQVREGANHISNNGPNISNADAIITNAGLQSAYRDVPDLLSKKPKPKPGPFHGNPAEIPGRIEAEDFDHGGPGEAYNDTTPLNQGGEYRPIENVDIELTLDNGGGYNVGYIVAGEWLQYTVDVTAAGTYDLKIRVASVHADRHFHLSLDGKNISGPIDVPQTGDWQNWETVTVKNIVLPEGEQKLRLQFDSGDFNINWIEFSSDSVSRRPEVALTSPASDSTFENGETIILSAEASADGEIAQVEFFADSELIGKTSKSPFTIHWQPKKNGTHTLTARATTRNGITGTSKAVKIDVLPGRGPLFGEPSGIPGTIFAVDYDLGGPGKAYHDLTPGNKGGAYRDDDVDIEVSEDPKADYNLGWFEAGEWIHYTVDIRRSGRYDLHLRLASAESDGKFHLLIDGKNITGPLTAPNTGGWQNWVTVTLANIELSAGIQTMRLSLDGGEFNISRFDFELAETSASFNEWIEANLSPDERDNPENSDPLADPHGDGIPNLLKYALGMTPGKINRKKLPQIGQTSIGSESYLTLTYSHPTAITDVEYIVEISNNLSDWVAADSNGFKISSEESNGLRTITVRDSRPFSGEKSRFLRLRVEAK